MSQRERTRRAPSVGCAHCRVRIAGLASTGEGVGHVELGGERRAVFVQRTAPGDLVDAQVDFARRPARGTLLSLVESSAERTACVCPVAETCGGCDFMHLRPEFQKKAHVDIVLEALAHAHLTVASVEAHEARATEHYRTRARLAVAASSGTVSLGYRREASHAIQSVRACAVLDARLEAVLAPMAEVFDREPRRSPKY